MQDDREPVRPRRGAMALAAAGVLAVGLMGATAIGAIPGGGDAATDAPAQALGVYPGTVQVQDDTQTQPGSPAEPGARGPGDCPPGGEGGAARGGADPDGTAPGAESSAPADTPAVTAF